MSFITVKKLQGFTINNPFDLFSGNFLVSKGRNYKLKLPFNVLSASNYLFVRTIFANADY